MGLHHSDGPHPADYQSAPTILDALGDSDSRRILDCLAGEPMVMTELVDELGIPRATAYRKVNALTRAGLVSQQQRFSLSGPTTTEYVTRLGSITISLGEDGPNLSLSLRENQPPLVADGGHPPESTDDDQQQLQELFFAVTGTDEITEHQEGDDRRFVAEKPDESLAIDVADVAREDGLDDTLPKPNSSE